MHEEFRISLTPDEARVYSDLREAFETNNHRRMVSVSIDALDHGIWEPVCSLAHDLLSRSEPLNPIRPIRLPRAAEDGRTAANLAFHMAKHAETVTCPACQGRGCSRCYSLGVVAKENSPPNPLMFYVRGLRLWWPRGFWSWLSYAMPTEFRTSENMIPFLEAFSRLSGQEFYEVGPFATTSRHLNYHGVTRDSSLLTPLVEPAAYNLAKTPPAKTLWPQTKVFPPESGHVGWPTPGLFLLGPSCPVLVDVPSCFCNDTFGCPEHPESVKANCQLCGGESFCLRCDNRSPIFYRVPEQEGFVHRLWAPGNTSPNRRGHLTPPPAPEPDIDDLHQLDRDVDDIIRRLAALRRRRGAPPAEEPPQEPAPASTPTPPIDLNTRGDHGIVDVRTLEGDGPFEGLVMASTVLAREGVASSADMARRMLGMGSVRMNGTRLFTWSALRTGRRYTLTLRGLEVIINLEDCDPAPPEEEDRDD